MSICRQFACATEGCQNTIHLHHQTEQKLRRTHESFFCPAGHSNYFPGASAEEKELRDLRHSVSRWQDLYDGMLDDREEWKLRAKTCPFGCGFRVTRKSKPENIDFALAAHLVDEHGAVFPAWEPATVEA